MAARRYPFLFTVAALIVVADQVSKLVVQVRLVPHRKVTVIEGFFDLVYVRNPGGAFGLFSRLDPSAVLLFFLLGTAATTVLIIYFYGRIPPRLRWYRFAFAFILGGAVGNLIDRVRLGQVVDFLDFHLRSYHWPAFNVADACISAGAVMFMVGLLRAGRE